MADKSYHVALTILKRISRLPEFVNTICSLKKAVSHYINLRAGEYEDAQHGGEEISLYR